MVYGGITTTQIVFHKSRARILIHYIVNYGFRQRNFAVLFLDKSLYRVSQKTLTP